MASEEGLRQEIISLESRLKEAEKNGDKDKVRYLEERIRRVEIDLSNKRYRNGLN